MTVVFTNNSADTKKKVSAILSFVNGTLRPVKSETDIYLAQWYREHSRIYVDDMHPCWESEAETHRAMRSRYGRVIRSDQAGVAKMMSKHQKEALEWVSSMCGEGSSEGDGEEGESE